MDKINYIALNAIPVLVMIGLIPLVQNDYSLTLAYVLVIAVAFLIRKEKTDFGIFVFGFFAMIASEYIFVSTGVETFVRNSLFGLMPLWLPFLWGYAFVAIKRSVLILEK